MLRLLLLVANGCFFGRGIGRSVDGKLGVVYVVKVERSVCCGGVCGGGVLCLQNRKARGSHDVKRVEIIK